MSDPVYTLPDSPGVSFSITPPTYRVPIRGEIVTMSFFGDATLAAMVMAILAIDDTGKAAAVFRAFGIEKVGIGEGKVYEIPGPPTP